MKLHELKNLREEALDTIKAEDLWAENEAAEYRSSTTYLVKQIKDVKPTMFEVFAVNGDQRKPYGKFNSAELLKVLQPIRANQNPDAEGFTTYIDKETVEAFQYSGDPVKVMLGSPGGQRLSKGDFVIRSNDGNDFVYSIEPASTFKATLVKT